ncbi:MAG: serine/threonine protein kinase [Myxococcales bacterium]|nr:serine/threonine protein kinase [Myxococcales bacterium]
MQPVNAIEVPSRLYGKYLVRSRVGLGGMAEVFLAEAVDAHGDQVQVALKLMRPEVPEEKIADEVDLMGLLSHPNLVRMLEHGRAFNRHFIALEFLIGGDLRQVMEAHRRAMAGFPANMGVHVVIEVLRGLAYLHTATTKTGTALSLIHSDVNPANVFFSGQGAVKLGDFGVASSAQLDVGPGEGIAAGKLSYLAPEQTRGERGSVASDLWSVGVMLHEMVVGYHPFQDEGASEPEVMNRIRAGKLSIPDYVDKPLAAVIQRALAVDPKVRYRSAGELAGPLFTWALDRNALPSADDVREWLAGAVGIVG